MKDHMAGKAEIAFFSADMCALYNQKVNQSKQDIQRKQTADDDFSGRTPRY
jgi:hypothetical protein